MEKKKDVKNEKMSYEQLEQIAGNLNQQCNSLYQQLQEAKAVIAEFNEIGMLLSILDKSEHFDSAFIDRCASKIQEIITKALDESEKKDNQN